MEMERQQNYTIAEGYELPSKGLIYDVPVDSHVELRSMTARDEMKRTGPSTMPYKLLADIIEGCMIEKPKVHVYDMALADYEFLLHKLRIVSYGDLYKMSAICTNCGSLIEGEAHLEELTLKDFDIAEYNELKQLTLPKSGHIVTLKCQTPRMLDEQAIKVKEFKARFKDAEIDFEPMAKMLATIDLVDGEKLNSSKLETFINSLPAMDMLKILNTVDKLNTCFGLDTSVTLTCKECGEEFKTFFRFGPEFFRPTNI